MIDLRRSSIHDLDALRDWKRFEVKEGQAITIKPGHMIMGRIYERFRIPANCAGKVEGRSSFARMGLAVHCTGDFINPGWEGYMPLQLTNLGPYPLRLAPYFSICQLMLVRLSGEPERTYGDEDLRSKYVNDDGGPSLWWRDERVRQLQERLGNANATEAIRREIVDTVRFQSTEVIARLQHHIDHKRVGQIENADQVLSDFARREKRRRLIDNATLTAPVLFGGAALAGVFVPFGLWLIVFIVLFAASLIAAFIAYERRDDGYLGPSELRAIEQRPGRPGIMTFVSAREASQLPHTCPVPGRYRHFKGREYELLVVARHSETEERFAVYRSVEDPDAIWVRPLEMFSGVVERPEGTFPRFAPAVTAERRRSSSLPTRLLRRFRLQSREKATPGRLGDIPRSAGPIIWQ